LHLPLKHNAQCIEGNSAILISPAGQAVAFDLGRDMVG